MEGTRPGEITVDAPPPGKWRKWRKWRGPRRVRLLSTHPPGKMGEMGEMEGTGPGEMRRDGLLLETTLAVSAWNPARIGLLQRQGRGQPSAPGIARTFIRIFMD